MTDPVQVYRPDSEEGRKAAACRNAVEKLAEHVGFPTFMNSLLCVLPGVALKALLDHVGFNIWMSAVLSTMAKSQAQASHQEFDAYVKKVSDMLWTQHRYDLQLIKPKLVS
jgi:hypothetical protein